MRRHWRRIPTGALEGSTPGTDALLTSKLGVAELMIPPRSEAIGMPVFPGMAASNGDLLILAVQRQGETLPPHETALAAGDALLVQGTWDALEANHDDADVLVVDSPDIVRRQAVPMGPGAGRTIGVLIAMVVLLATGVVPAAVGSLLAACALILLGVLSPNQAYRAISWTTIVLIGGMVPLSHALQSTGAAEPIAQGLVRVVGDAGPYPLLLGLILITAILGQLISNTATALVVIPIALSAADAFGVTRPTDADGRQRDVRRRIPHAGGHTREHDGDGSRRATSSTTTGSWVCPCWSGSGVIALAGCPLSRRF